MDVGNICLPLEIWSTILRFITSPDDSFKPTLQREMISAIEYDTIFSCKEVSKPWNQLFHNLQLQNGVMTKIKFDFYSLAYNALTSAKHFPTFSKLDTFWGDNVFFRLGLRHSLLQIQQKQPSSFDLSPVIQIPNFVICQISTFLENIPINEKVDFSLWDTCIDSMSIEEPNIVLPIEAPAFDVILFLFLLNQEILDLG